MGAVKRWRARRRINRLLNAVGWPKDSRSVFSGDVRMDCVRYADFYVTHYNSPKESEFPS